MAALAVPLEAIALARPARALDHQAHGVGGTARRMRHVGRQQEDLAFADGNVHAPAALHGGQRDAALELVEKLLARIDVEILAAVRTADHHDDELAVREHLLVAHRRLQQVAVLVDPALEVEGPEFFMNGIAHRGIAFRGVYGIRWRVHDVTVSTNARPVAARRQPYELSGPPGRVMFAAVIEL